MSGNRRYGSDSPERLGGPEKNIQMWAGVQATKSQPGEAAAHERNEPWAAQDPINHRIRLQRAGKFVLQIPEMYSGDSQNGEGWPEGQR